MIVGHFLCHGSISVYQKRAAGDIELLSKDYWDCLLLTVYGLL